MATALYTRAPALEIPGIDSQSLVKMNLTNRMLKNPEYQMKNHLMEKFLAEKHGDIFKLKKACYYYYIIDKFYFSSQFSYFAQL